MNDLLRDLTALYGDAFARMVQSLRRAWPVILAIYAYTLGLFLIGAIGQVIPSPMLAGLLVAIADALAVGALLALMQRTISDLAVGLSDIPEVVGTYFWDVIAVGFVLWIPLILIDMVAHMSGQSHLLLPMISVLLAVFFNPLPEVIYQCRTGSPLEALGESARFVQQHWIEWFLPMVLIAAPLGSLLFYTSGSMRGGLSFGYLISLSASLTRGLADLLGLPSGAALFLVLVGAPIVTFLLLSFRGHLFAALVGSTRRQRAFRRLSG
jgi:hypothetical protein